MHAFSTRPHNLAGYSWKDGAAPSKASELALCSSWLTPPGRRVPVSCRVPCTPPRPSTSLISQLSARCLSASLSFSLCLCSLHSVVFWYLKPTTTQRGQTKATKMRMALVIVGMHMLEKRKRKTLYFINTFQFTKRCWGWFSCFAHYLLNLCCIISLFLINAD